MMMSATVTFAAGLAAQGMRPFCAIYSTFLQRGYDQLIHDVAVQNLDVLFAIDGSGSMDEEQDALRGANGTPAADRPVPSSARSVSTRFNNSMPSSW